VKINPDKSTVRSVDARLERVVDSLAGDTRRPGNPIKKWRGRREGRGIPRGGVNLYRAGTVDEIKIRQ